MRAVVTVMLKRDVLDPQGAAIVRACGSMGYDEIRDVRQGKVFEIELDAPDEATARARVEELSGKLLSNPVIEDFRLDELKG